MRRIKGPNGLVFSWPDGLVAALVRDGEHVEVKDEPTPEPKPVKKAAPKPSK